MRDSRAIKAASRSRFPAAFEYADDQMTMFLQGSTQYDALGHVWYDDQLWNGYPASETIGGMAKASILPIAERGVVGRGVLLDMAAYRGQVRPGQGRPTSTSTTCSARRRSRESRSRSTTSCACGSVSCSCCTRSRTEQFYKDFNEPGLTYSPELVDWFHKMEIPALCTDTISNEMRFRSRDRRADAAALRADAQPWRHLQRDLQLRGACARLPRDGQWDFLYVGAPLKVHRGDWRSRSTSSRSSDGFTNSRRR